MLDATLLPYFAVTQYAPFCFRVICRRVVIDAVAFLLVSLTLRMLITFLPPRPDATAPLMLI